MTFIQCVCFIIITPSSSLGYTLLLDENTAFDVNPTIALQASICALVIDSPDNSLSCTPDTQDGTAECQPVVNIDGRIFKIDDSIIFSDHIIQLASSSSLGCTQPNEPANESGLVLQIGNDLWDLAETIFEINAEGTPTLYLNTLSKDLDCPNSLPDIVLSTQFEM